MVRGMGCGAGVAGAQGFVGSAMVVLVAGGARGGRRDEARLGGEGAGGMLRAQAAGDGEGVVSGGFWREGLQIGGGVILGWGRSL